MPERVQLRRTKGWRMPPNTVKVDRSTKWGNPITIAKDGVGDGKFTAGSRREAVAMFTEMMSAASLADDYGYPRLDIVDELRGKNLACWCPLNEPCHADVLLAMANGPQDRKRK